VVDDDEDTLTSTALLLEKCGFEVQTAQDGTAALSLASQAAFDLVLLDLALPKLDGYAVAHVLTRLPTARCPPLVAVSGHGMREDVLRSAQAGFDLHLTKPVDPALLAQLPLLFERAEAALQAAQRLAEQHRRVMSALLHQQLRMAWACAQLAEHERAAEPKKRLLLRAAQLCARVAEKTAILGPEQAQFIAEIVALQQRIAAVTYQSVEPE
jgi:DNA-binding response OmpR family regulator